MKPPSTNTGYLKPADIANKLKGARQWGDNWSARCPCHDDKLASLRISKGRKATLIYCHAGCATPNILAELGHTMSELYYDHDLNNPHSPTTDTDIKLQQMIRNKTAPTVRELAPDRTLGDVLYRILPASAAVWTWVRLRWFDWFEMPYPEAMKKWYVVTDAICADLMVREIDAGYDYTVTERRRMRDRLEDEWETNGPIVSK